MIESPVHRRPVRSFVLREGRITNAQARAFRRLWPRFGVDWRPGVVLDLAALFGNANPVYLEIGFGDGESLAAMASRYPDRNYLGIEVHRPGVGHLLLACERLGLDNLRVMRHDAVEILGQGLSRACLAGVYLLFPDPWPKKRHHKRRILKPETARLLGRVIRPGGLFHAATDWVPYAEQMLEVLSGAEELFENAAGDGAYSARPRERSLTKFEQRGLRLGHPVRDLLFRRR